MSQSPARSRTSRLLASFAALAVGAGLIVGSGSGTVGADPKALDAYVTLGSDTTQDVLNGLSGFNNGNFYTPVASAAASGYRVLSSFDANLPPGVSDRCITPKVKAPTIYRSNGSSEGRRALSRAIDGTGYGPAGECGGTKDVAGLVDFARSSAGPSGGDTGTALTYVPFGRDGVSFAYYRASGGAAVTSLTRAQLTSLFTTGPQTIGGVRIIPCGIQTGSGTYQFWNTVTTATVSQDDTATTECNNLGGTGRLQEHDGLGLKAKGDLAPAGQQVIVGFSAGQFIAQENGVSPDRVPTGSVDLGTITDPALGKPYSGTVPNLLPNSSFFNNAVFGRAVYNVLETAKLTNPGNNALKEIFVGRAGVDVGGGVGVAALCSPGAQQIVNRFGFSTPTDCGSQTVKGSLLPGIK
jgi:ABC-type phosphate transport system substrate-binding protein